MPPSSSCVWFSPWFDSLLGLGPRPPSPYPSLVVSITVPLFLRRACRRGRGGAPRSTVNRTAALVGSQTITVRAHALSASGWDEVQPRPDAFGAIPRYACSIFKEISEPNMRS